LKFFPVGFHRVFFVRQKGSGKVTPGEKGATVHHTTEQKQDLNCFHG
jgi:hypothetical protein